jgi:hypothetical protein
MYTGPRDVSTRIQKRRGQDDWGGMEVASAHSGETLQDKPCTPGLWPGLKSVWTGSPWGGTLGCSLSSCSPRWLKPMLCWNVCRSRSRP